MSRKTWTVVNRIKIDLVIWDIIKSENMELIWPAKAYPYLAKRQLNGILIRVQDLHLFVDDQLSPTPRPPGVHVHHKNHQKGDARFSNLVRLSPEAHGRLHKKERRKFGRRKRDSISGLRYLPHAPAPVKKIDPALVAAQFKPPATADSRMKLSEKRELLRLERWLQSNYWRLREALRLWESTKPLRRPASKAEWAEPKVRMQGIKRPRLECTKAEAALVMFYITALRDSGSPVYRENPKNPDLVAIIAHDVLEPRVDLLRKILARPSVQFAIENWFKTQRLPPTAESDELERRQTSLPTEAQPPAV